MKWMILPLGVSLFFLGCATKPPEKKVEVVKINFAKGLNCGLVINYEQAVPRPAPPSAASAPSPSSSLPHTPGLDDKAEIALDPTAPFEERIPIEDLDSPGVIEKLGLSLSETQLQINQRFKDPDGHEWKFFVDAEGTFGKATEFSVSVAPSDTAPDNQGLIVFSTPQSPREIVNGHSHIIEFQRLKSQTGKDFSLRLDCEPKGLPQP